MIIVCYNRCLFCGRRTNHEVCHAHSSHGYYRTRFGGDLLELVVGRSPDARGRNYDKLWTRNFYKEPEVCKDEFCPQALADWM